MEKTHEHIHTCTEFGAIFNVGGFSEGAVSTTHIVMVPTQHHWPLEIECNLNIAPIGYMNGESCFSGEKRTNGSAYDCGVWLGVVRYGSFFSTYCTVILSRTICTFSFPSPTALLKARAIAIRPS